MEIHATVGRAIDYILEHLEDNPSVEQVAAHCHFSKYHFSRLFKAETGESPYAFIRRLRLEESAFRLKVEPGRAVTDVGYDCGYSPSNYSVAFRQRFGTNPVEFRRRIGPDSFRHPFCHQREEERESAAACGRKVEVRELPELCVIYERRIGDYHDLSREWPAFLERYRDWRGPGSRCLVRSFDDPSITSMDGCLYDMCLSVPADCPAENLCRIPGGRYLVYPFRGPVWNIYAAYQTLFNLWLPRTGYRLDQQYSYDLYRQMDRSPGYVEMDICLPLRREALP